MGVTTHTAGLGTWGVTAALLVGLAGCSVTVNGGDTDGETDTDTDPTTGVDPTTGGGDTSAEPTSAASTDGGSTTDTPTTNDPETTSTTTGDGDDTTGGGVDANCNFSEDFEGIPDGDPWPDNWVAVGNGVAAADVVGGRGRLRSVLSGYSLARITTFDVDCSEVDAWVTFQFTDGNTQGMGLYARNNGGFLRDTDPWGEGYAAFAEAFRTPVGIGLWREVEGREQNLPPVEGFPLEAGVDYRVHFRLTQQDETTSLLQTKIWLASDPEPDEWNTERTDTTASLQNVGGALALDAWSSDVAAGGETAFLLFDDVLVQPAR